MTDILERLTDRSDKRTGAKRATTHLPDWVHQLFDDAAVEIRRLRSTGWRTDMANAPKDPFIWLWCPEDQSRWLAMWQGGRWHGVDDLGLTRTDGYHKGSESVTGWEIMAWREVPAPPAEVVRRIK